jgi:hypothetical protein
VETHRVEADVATCQTAVLAPIGTQTCQHPTGNDVRELERPRREAPVKERIAEGDRPDAGEGRAERCADRA